MVFVLFWKFNFWRFKMGIWTWEEGQKSNEALSYYKSLGITKRDLYGCANICKSHKDFMVVLDFDEYGNERGLMIEKERVIPNTNINKKSFEIGAEIKHKIFGIGKILDRRDGLEESIYSVQFNNIKRDILESFLAEV